MRSTTAFNDSLGGEDGRWRAALSTAAVHGPQEAHRKLCRARKLRFHPRTAMDLQYAEHLRPNGHHGQKERNRCQCYSLFNDRLHHDCLPFVREHKGNIVRVLFLSQARVVSQFELWRPRLIGQAIFVNWPKLRAYVEPQSKYGGPMKLNFKHFDGRRYRNLSVTDDAGNTVGTISV